MNDDFLEDFWINASPEFNQRLREEALIQQEKQQEFLSKIYNTVPIDIEKKLNKHYKNVILNNGLFDYSCSVRDFISHPKKITECKTSQHIFPSLGNIGLISLSENTPRQKQTKDFLIYLNTMIEQDIHGFMDKIFVENFALPIFHKTYHDMINEKNLLIGDDYKYIPINNIVYCYNHKSTGFNNKFCCPFHQEKTPSFRYSFTKKKFYCFGCAYNMNVFGLTAIVLGISVTEAIYFLCKMYNVKPDIFRYPKMKYPLSIWGHML